MCSCSNCSDSCLCVCHRGDLDRLFRLLRGEAARLILARRVARLSARMESSRDLFFAALAWRYRFYCVPPSN